MSFLKKLQQQIADSGLDISDQSVVENELGKACDKAIKKEEKFVRFLCRVNLLLGALRTRTHDDTALFLQTTCG